MPPPVESKSIRVSGAEAESQLSSDRKSAALNLLSSTLVVLSQCRRIHRCLPRFKATPSQNVETSWTGPPSPAVNSCGNDSFLPDLNLVFALWHSFLWYPSCHLPLSLMATTNLRECRLKILRSFISLSFFSSHSSAKSYRVFLMYIEIVTVAGYKRGQKTRSRDVSSRGKSSDGNLPDT